MHEIAFIQDLAIIMLVAGIITVLFHRLKQPVVLGYILAGIIVGPYTPPFDFISDKATIKIFAELGVIFLMFSLGLEFSLQKLRKVGIGALIAALLEIIVMIFIGYEIGIIFHWSSMNALFLGAMLAISSTTIIVKALGELGLQKENFVQLIYGILIIEDVLAIGIIALLSSLSTSDYVGVGATLTILIKLLIFLTVSFVVGILVVPRLIAYVARFKSQEMMLITVLGLCFGFCLLVVELDFSIVLGAFVVGAIIAESTHAKAIEKMVVPLRDMFSAVFFVSVGLMFNPHVFITYTTPIIVITLAVILGKVITCSLGAYVTGRDGRTALRVGMGLAQIGEFSFIIAALGMQSKVTGDFLYPIAVAVSALTTITTPYLIKAADPLANRIAHFFPGKVSYIFQLYTSWLQSLQSKDTSSEVAKLVKHSLFNIFINLAVVAAIFLTISWFTNDSTIIISLPIDIRLEKTIFWGGALFLSLPFLLAIYRQLQTLSMLLAELSVKRSMPGRFTEKVRRIISEVIPIISMSMLFLFICALSASILPPGEFLMIVLGIAIILAAVLWRWLVRFHSRLHSALLENVKNK